jgi:protein-disulfide isomerase
MQRRLLLGQAAALDGFDTQEFETCLDTKAGAARVDADVALGKEIGAGSTPTLFVDGQQLAGGYRTDQIRTLIREITERPGAETGSEHRR